LAYLDIVIDVNADGKKKCSSRWLGEWTLKSHETCR
jgi:hypothetical protein